MTKDTRTMLLDEAELLLRTRGYAAFSYADLADKVGIRKASIHHHFPTKDDLGVSVVARYLDGFAVKLREIDQDYETSTDRLRAYAGFFTTAQECAQLPLCGALAAEAHALPESMRKLTKEFFNLHIDWLARTVRSGIAGGEFIAQTDPQRASRLLLSVLEGSSLTTWVLDDPLLIQGAFETVLASLQAP